MRKIIRFYFLILSISLFTNTGYAEVKLPAIVSSNTVLQRNTAIALWGWADTNEKITISTSWLSEEIKIVADRLLYNALNQTYGYEAVDFSGPVLYSFKIMNDTIMVTFKYAEHGIYCYDELAGFEIAGTDKVFYPAIATNNRDGVFVKSDKVKNPVAIRYAWRSWVQGTLFDTKLLPASSFRTDNWDDAKQSE